MLDKVKKYYSEKIITHGASPNGVDWNGLESQELRFKILSSIIQQEESFSLLDYGCGYGALLSFLKKDFKKFDFIGYDISQEMLKVAESLNSDAKWINVIPNNFSVDYTFCSGIFNVLLDIEQKEWEKYIFETLNYINTISTKGFAFNLLSTYSDVEKAKKHLYYASPEDIFRYCKVNFSKNVILDHSYPLYEFSVLVKK